MRESAINSYLSFHPKLQSSYSVGKTCFVAYMLENILNMEGFLESNSPRFGFHFNRGWVSSPGSQDVSVPFRFACPKGPSCDADFPG